MAWPLKTKIPKKILENNPPKSVHVEGWNFACVFIYLGTDKYGIHKLMTPKTRRVYYTDNDLLYLRKDEPIC